jgi:uncharacterized membrane protein YqjE
MENQNKKNNLRNIILFAVIDFITLIYGIFSVTYGLVHSIEDNRGQVTTGITLIVLFFLIRLWRKEYRERNMN